jgi:phosphatidylglycerophosphate synthase
LVDAVKFHSSALQETVALAVLAFIALIARISIGGYRRRPQDPGIVGSAVLGPGIRGWYFENLQPFEEWCVRRGVSPAYLSYAQLAGSALVGACYATGMLFTAGWLLLLTGTLDIIDGRVARRTAGASARGAFLDSVIDRYVESFAYFGLAAFFRDSWVLWAVLFALLGSTMVSYARARGEGLGMDIRVGIFQRPERVVILGFGSIFGSAVEHLTEPWFPGPGYTVVILTVLAVAVLTNITALQRIIHTWRELVGQPVLAARASAPSGAPPLAGAPTAQSLPGKGKRVLGTFLLMIGAGFILDCEALWIGGLVGLGGACTFVTGCFHLRARLTSAASASRNPDPDAPAGYRIP